MRSKFNTQSKPATWHWLLLVPALLLLLCTLAGVTWWQYYKTTPSYSLALIVDAAERNDITAFENLFLMDRVVEKFATEVAQSKGIDSPDLLRRRLQSIDPGVTATIKPIVSEGVRRRVLEIAEESANAPFILTSLGVFMKAKVTEEGNTATATISQGDERLELKLERMNRQWKVVAVKDEALTSRIMANLAKELPLRIPSDGLSNPLDGLLPKTIP